MARNDVLIPDRGIVSLAYLSEMTGIQLNTLTQKLTDNGVPFLKLGGYRRDWYVNLRKLDAISFGESGFEGDK